MADYSNLVAPRQVYDEWTGQSNYTPIFGVNEFGSFYDQFDNPIIRGYQDQNGNVWDSFPKIVDEYGNYSTPKLLVNSEVAQDPYISSIGILKLDTNAANDLYRLRQTNPDEFYKQVASKLEDNIYGDWKYNNTNANTQVARNLLEGIKDVNPQAYYTAKLTDLGRSIGWQIGQNRNDRNAPTIEAVKAMIPDAMKSGLTADQINSIVGNNTNYANSENQQRIANEAASGGNFWTENLIGALKVGALGLGAAGLDSALTAAASAAPYTGMDAAASAYLGGSSGAFVPAEGFSAILPQVAAPAYTGMDAAANAYLGAPSGSFVPAEGFSATLPSVQMPIGDQIGDYPMPGESGTANQWIPSNINPQDVTNLLDYNAAYANGGLSLSDIASGANKARQAFGVGNTIAKLLGGTGVASGTSGTSGLNVANLANALRSQNTFTPINLQQIQPKSPFFGSNQGTLSGEDVYDVSGSNIANALRKR